MSVALLVRGLLLLAAAGAVTVTVSECRRGRVNEVRLERRLGALEAELTVALQREQGMRELVEARLGQRQEDRLIREQEASGSPKPMPEGVRRTLVSLNEALRRDGHSGARFIHARAIEEKVLRGVEFIDHDSKTLVTSIYLADRVSFHLDRMAAMLTIRLSEGCSYCSGERQDLPEVGHSISLAGVDGPIWERSVPQLLQVQGVYPEDRPKIPATQLMDRATAASWEERLNRLLDAAQTSMRYRIENLGGIESGFFRDVVVLGYKSGKTLGSSFEAARLQVQIDRKSKTVELLFEDGMLRHSGGQTRISEEGYRLLLPQVTVDDAMEWMLGMVKKR